MLAGRELPPPPAVIDSQVQQQQPQAQRSPSRAAAAAAPRRLHMHQPPAVVTRHVTRPLLPQAVHSLLAQIGAGSEPDRIFAAHQLAALVETEEAKFRALVGDPSANPNLRSHYAIGKILAAVKVCAVRGRGSRRRRAHASVGRRVLCL